MHPNLIAIILRDPRAARGLLTPVRPERRKK